MPDDALKWLLREQEAMRDSIKPVLHEVESAVKHVEVERARLGHACPTHSLQDVGAHA